MNTRPVRRVWPVNDLADDSVITFRGRPKDNGRPIMWVPVVLRLLIIAWAGAVVVALLDEYGLVGHLPFLTAMGMTGLLVASMFMVTRDETYLAERSRRRGDDDDDDEQDLLTSLPTFAAFGRRLNEEFNRSRRQGRQMAVVLVDVNNLTAVNKEYGVRAGDEVLRHVAQSVDGTRRFSDVVARLGDDEFGVLLMNTGEAGVAAFIDRLEERLARDSAVAEVDGRSISLWAGICSGSAVSTSAMTSADAVLEAAMANLNRAKQERERRRRMWLSA